MLEQTVEAKLNAPEYVLEWAPFELKPGVAEADLLAASDALQTEFLEQQPGFIRRELLRGKDRQWVDTVYWRSLEAAEAASRLVMDSPVCLRYFELMIMPENDDPNAGISHFAHVRTYA
jgi:hypothetical protein